MTTEEFFDAIPRTGMHPDDLDRVRRVIDKLSPEDRATLAAMVKGVAEEAADDARMHDRDPLNW